MVFCARTKMGIDSHGQRQWVYPASQRGYQLLLHGKYAGYVGEVRIWNTASPATRYVRTSTRTHWRRSKIPRRFVYIQQRFGPTSQSNPSGLGLLGMEATTMLPPDRTERPYSPSQHIQCKTRYITRQRYHNAHNNSGKTPNWAIRQYSHRQPCCGSMPIAYGSFRIQQFGYRDTVGGQRHCIIQPG